MSKGKIRSEKWWKELALVMKNYKLIEVKYSHLITLKKSRKKKRWILPNLCWYILYIRAENFYL